MSWNYRIIFHDTDPDPEKHWYGLHEVYYSENGKLSWTAEPISFVCDPEEGSQGIIGSLKRALKTLDDPTYSEVLRETLLLKLNRDNDDVSC